MSSSRGKDLEFLNIFVKFMPYPLELFWKDRVGFTTGRSVVPGSVVQEVAHESFG